MWHFDSCDILIDNILIFNGFFEVYISIYLLVYVYYSVYLIIYRLHTYHVSAINNYSTVFSCLGNNDEEKQSVHVYHSYSLSPNIFNSKLVGNEDTEWADTEGLLIYCVPWRFFVWFVLNSSKIEFSLYIAPFYLLFCAIIIYILITIYEKLNIINIICSLYNLPLKELREKRRVCKYW